MLANLQRVITLSLLALALGWLFYWRNTSPLLAVVGFLVIVLGYTAFLALEFLLLRFINKKDPAPQPTWAELASAWLGETLTAPRVFCWRLPFRTFAVPDKLVASSAMRGQPGVVFIHGFFCNRGLWTPWLERLQEQGRVFAAVSLEPIFGSIDDYAPQIDAAVRQVTGATGVPPLLVCHSMGGLAARAWLKAHGSEARVRHVVTIGTPHRGTWLARFGHGHNGLQMRLTSDWLGQLDEGMHPERHARFTCWYSNTDNIVFPTSTATLPGADNRLVRGAAHVQMAFLPEVMNTTLALLDVSKR
ncbi:MAG: alpha/beta fold hydrolase [Pseudomonadota bacterium]